MISGSVMAAIIVINDHNCDCARSRAGDFIGSIGVSGGTVEEDLEIARAAAEAVALLF